MRSRLLGLFGGRGDARAEIEPRDRKTGADKLPVQETAFGRRAAIYSGRRLLCEQVIMGRAGILGRRFHEKHWLVIYVMGGQIEVRWFKPDRPEPYHAFVVTPRSEPLTIPAGIHYEVLALCDCNLMFMQGNYTGIDAADARDYVQLQADEGPQQIAMATQ